MSSRVGFAILTITACFAAFAFTARLEIVSDEDEWSFKQILTLDTDEFVGLALKPARRHAKPDVESEFEHYWIVELNVWTDYWYRDDGPEMITKCMDRIEDRIPEINFGQRRLYLNGTEIQAPE